MRASTVADCKSIFAHFNVDTLKGIAIDIGGTEKVNLNGVFSDNPLKEFNPNLKFLDKGFNIDVIETNADNRCDFLEMRDIKHLYESFDLVYSFDTLEHIPNPFLFCEHLIYITKPGGYFYVSTLFSYGYHPSPEDYFRFSPPGLATCFTSELNKLRDCCEILWCGWDSEKFGVALLGRKK